ncbi:MAG TPA: PAS domain S-box protein, partial [Candidatus Caenarcaniphilales bacterium]
MKKVRLFGTLEITVAGVGLIAIALLSYATSFTTGTLQRQRQMVQASQTLQIKVALAHLWLEHAIEGDKSININQNVYGNIDESLAQCRAMLHGNQARIGQVQPINRAEDRDRLKLLCHQLQRWRILTAQRLKTPASSEAGTATGKAHDVIFNKILQLAEQDQKAREATSATADARLNELNKLTIMLLLGLFAGTAEFVRRNRYAAEVKNEALRESERRLASLIGSLPGIVFSSTNDPHWSMTYLSDGCLNLTGYSSDELVGNGVVSYNSITQPEDLPKVLNAINIAIAQKQPYVIEYRIRTKSGEEKWFWEKGHGVFDSHGEVLALEGFITDVTERKRLEEVSFQMASIVESSNDAIISMTLDGKIVSWNSGAERIYGYPAAEVKDRSVSILIPADRPNEEPEIIERIKQGERIDHYESVRVRQDGTVIDVSLTISPVKDAAGKTIGASKIARDITQRKQVEAALQESNRRLEDHNVVLMALARRKTLEHRDLEAALKEL